MSSDLCSTMFYLFSGVQHHLRRSDRPCTILTPADVFFVQNHTATQENTYTPCRPLEDHFPSTIRWCHPLMHDDFRDCCFHLPDHQIHPPRTFVTRELSRCARRKRRARQRERCELGAEAAQPQQEAPKQEARLGIAGSPDRLSETRW